MRFLTFIFVIFLFAMVFAFFLESQNVANIPEVESKQSGTAMGHLKWKSLPRWHIPVAPKEEAPKKSLLDSILDDDVCAFLKNESINDYDMLLEAYLQSVSRSDEYPLLTPLKAQDDGNSLASRFYRALRHGGLLAGASGQKDLQKALTELEELESLDPDNSAYPLYAAVLMAQLNYPPEAQIETLFRAFKKNRMDTFAPDIGRALTHSGRTTTQFLASQVIWSRIPVPSFTEANELLVRHMDNDPTLKVAKAVTWFSNKILKSAQQQAPATSEFAFNIVEYETARRLYEKGYKMTTNEEIQVPSFKSLIRAPASSQNMTEILLMALDPMQKSMECERNPIDEIYYRWKLDRH